MTRWVYSFSFKWHQSTVNASSKSGFFITIILHRKKFQWVLSHCVISKPVPRIDEKPQTSELRVLFYHYISRSSIYINFFFWVWVNSYLLRFPVQPESRCLTAIIFSFCSEKNAVVGWKCKCITDKVRNVFDHDDWILASLSFALFRTLTSFSRRFRFILKEWLFYFESRERTPTVFVAQ